MMYHPCKGRDYLVSCLNPIAVEARKAVYCDGSVREERCAFRARAERLPDKLTVHTAA